MSLVLVDARDDSLPGQVCQHRVVEVCDVAASASNGTKLIWCCKTVVNVLAVKTIRVKLLVGPKLVFVLFIAVVITTESLPTEEEFLDVEPLPVFDDQVGFLKPSLAVVFV